LLLCHFKEKFRQLLEINEIVGGALDDTNPNRELIKEGKITKVSARDGAHLERYLFLVSTFVCLLAEVLMQQLKTYKYSKVSICIAPYYEETHL